MRRRPKLDAGNFPSWEERIDYQIECAFDRCDRLRETDHDLYRRVGELQGRVDRAATTVEVQMLRDTIRNCVAGLIFLTVLCVALTAAVVWLVVA